MDTGRLGAIGTKHITTKRPVASIPSAFKSFPTHSQAQCTREISYLSMHSVTLPSLDHDFKVAFLEECLVPVMKIVARIPSFGLKEQNYYEILELDKHIRDFKLPPVLAEPINAPQPPDASESMSAASPANLDYILNPTSSPTSFNLFYSCGKAPRNILRLIRAKAQQEKLFALLYLHRAFFYAHIRDHRPVVQRLYLPSTLTCFSAACEIIRIVRDVYSSEPLLAARVSHIWYDAFHATVSSSMWCQSHSLLGANPSYFSGNFVHARQI